MLDRTPYLFISYRRDDTRWIARILYRYLSVGYGANRVFMDRIEIRGGDDWKSKISEKLRQATVVLVIIGPQWLTLQTSVGRPRIDGEDDWVRTEVRTGLEDGRRLVPLYVDGATPISNPALLPLDLQRLVSIQGIELHEKLWDASLIELVNQLKASGLQAHKENFSMPPQLKRVDPLTDSQLEEALRTLPGWCIATTYISDDVRFSRIELYKEYSFNTFVEATRFMASISPEIENGQHHPRWENIWKTVRVWLSTWDIEFKPSEYDVLVARKLDKAYKSFNFF
jgi:pterin-4a-carbinolamine dehydratase